MAEGDMSQPHEQEGVMHHGQEASDSYSVNFQDNLDHNVSEQNIYQAQQAKGLQSHKKKSSFQITSVRPTTTETRGRGSNGYDDMEDVEGFDGNDISLGESFEEIPEHRNVNLNGGENGNSRFKLVKIPKCSPYLRGRWTCYDYFDSDPSSTSLHSNSSELKSDSSVDISQDKSIVGSSKSSFPSGNETVSEQQLQTESLLRESVQNHLPVERKATSSLPFESLPCQDKAVGTEVSLVKKELPESVESIDNSAGKTVENLDSQTSKSLRLEQSLNDAIGSLNPEMPIVNTVQTAMEQITQIKSTLLNAVSEEVSALKSTIDRLKEENAELKQENERLKKAVVVIPDGET